MSIERYEPDAPRAITHDFDSWVPVINAVADLATRIAGTDFVPDAMRGKPAAVAAAILAGREMGIGPMTALQNIHIIKGKPGQSAQLMRSLVYAAGHSIKIIETTDTRCVVDGRRQDEDEWTRVTFTADQARRAKIDLGFYPEDKLFARATSRLCRRKFSDCLAGMAYSIEELEDGDTDDRPTIVSALPARTATRTAKRAAPKEPEQSVTIATRAEAQAAPQDTVPPPPLPGEETTETDNQGVTRAQLSMMHAIFNEFAITNRAERLNITRSLLSRRDLTSSNELTREDASTLIDMLAECQRADDPMAALTALAAIGQPDDDEPDDDEPEPAA